MKRKLPVRKLVGVFLLVAFIGLTTSPPFISYVKLPVSMTMFTNSQPVQVDALPGIEMESAPSLTVQKDANKVSVEAKKSGVAKLHYTLGGFPIKQSEVRMLDDIRLIPGGQSIGVRLNAGGVLIVGYHDIDTKKGILSPGKASGLQTGDMIVQVNGQAVTTMKNFGELVQKAGKAGKAMKLEVKRNDQSFETSLQPQLDPAEQKYRLGLYIKEAASGIGTMTFIDPDTKRYGSLGHVIADRLTKEPVSVYEGELLLSQVTSITKGNQGVPGEKIAAFLSEGKSIGTVQKNTPFGVFGTLQRPFPKQVDRKPIPITVASQVKKGPAQLLTVVEGQEIEAFDIEIVNSIPQRFPATKGMVIKVTDPALLDKTGGIVQGMSGSPIIQDGKLVGAVTHVFVNDPTSGYGIHIEWMLKEAGVLIEHKDDTEQKAA
ncbi:SpoIVB peptidase [Bacillaceae bacterium SIJ1]|uniref:SpoIVB peptidase n=1 Tax=Litoribacterium kuwaitense TaxID=1398745 RepID=UPI0013EC953B|nr:SpoIVB peptidase [Litoribacterium kuwaitense]NGP43617.1 SpoIVB peptidase [Litoribacterium kuwaitense]